MRLTKNQRKIIADALHCDGYDEWIRESHEDEEGNMPDTLPALEQLRRKFPLSDHCDYNEVSLMKLKLKKERVIMMYFDSLLDEYGADVIPDMIITNIQDAFPLKDEDSVPYTFILDMMRWGYIDWKAIKKTYNH